MSNMIMLMGILSSGGDNLEAIPEFTYSGTYKLEDEGNGNFKLTFNTSGTLIITKLNSASKGIDIFGVGGGGGGGSYGGGGGGGYTRTMRAYRLKKGTYSVAIGAAGQGAIFTEGTGGKQGGTTSLDSFKAAGGYGAGHNTAQGSGGGGNGGSGGAARDSTDFGTDGNNSGSGGKGQRSKPGPNGETGTTRAFGESNGTLYSPGGTGKNGGGTQSIPGAGGGMGYNGSAGYSGILIIRNARS